MQNKIEGNTRVVIASVLKPVDDTRSYEKIGATLADMPGFVVTIVGQPSRSNADPAPVRFLPLRSFSRLSLRRFIAPFYITVRVMACRPRIFIISTHELLHAALWVRLLLGSIIIYDVQENYYRNIRHTSAFPKVLRLPLALWARLKEKLTAPFIDHFLLAEAGYAEEMKFFRRRFTVLANKAVVPFGFKRSEKPNPGTHLLFSGTIDDSTGIFTALEWACRLRAVDPSVTLTIIGFCARESCRKQLQKAISDKRWVTTIGINKLVPHGEIIQAIATADFGIVCYPLSPHVANAIPTKLYEYLACRLPILLQSYKPWITLCEPYSAAVIVPDNFDAAQIIKQMQAKFYTQEPYGVTWLSEQPKLHALMESFMKRF